MFLDTLITNRMELQSFKIKASKKHDAGLRDLFSCVQNNVECFGNQPMDNKQTFPNEGLVVGGDPENYPASDHLFEISCHYKATDLKRNYVLIIEDMENGYGSYVRHCIPPVKKLITQFRDMKLPIVWSNWARR